MTIWKWMNHEGVWLYDFGVNPDGTLHNPRGYPDEVVRAASAVAQERLRKRRSAAATKAAATRQRRTEKRVYEAAQRIADGEVFGPRDNCYICGRGLGDAQSVQRGIGSDCWQDILAAIESRPA